jgi:hypothetical protein
VKIRTNSASTEFNGITGLAFIFDNWFQAVEFHKDMTKKEAAMRLRVLADNIEMSEGAKSGD